MENRKYKLTVSKAVKNFPTIIKKQKVTLPYINLELGFKERVIDNYRINKSVVPVLDMVFMNPSKLVIAANWKSAVKTGMHWVLVIEKVRLILNCEIWDLIEIKQAEKLKM